MTLLGFVQIILIMIILLVASPLLGSYMSNVFQRERTFLDPVLAPLEKLIYRISFVKDREMSWREYAIAVLGLGFVGGIFLYILLRAQGALPLNPEGRGALAPDLAFNTAVSFMTHTNWQAYPGERLAYSTQMLGLTVQNFLAAGTGLAVAAAFIRGFARKTSETIGNFWVDLTRSILWILLPLTIVFSFVLITQGAVQALGPYATVRTLEGARQTIAMGPVASQEAIKLLGTNGGGFFNANSSHPFENPTPLSNFLEVSAILVIPAALTYTFGKMIGDVKQGRAILAAMLILFLVGLGLASVVESQGNPLLPKAIDQSRTADQPGGNMEGKEVRFGPLGSALFAVTTTAVASGAVNSSHDSYMPISGAVLLFNMMLSEVVFGGVGSGLFTMLVFAIVAVFIAGLMVGRTPEYIGKKIEAREMKMAMLIVLVAPALILSITALAAVIPSAREAALNHGPHGFSEILYAVTSATANNGSAFAGLAADTPFYDIFLGIAMMFGRFAIIVPALAIAGSLAAKKAVPETAGTFPTTGPLFVGLLIGVVVIVGALTFFPALALGPLVEQLLVGVGTVF